MDYYIKYFNNIHHLEIKGVTPEARNLILKYSWQNIRELRNVIEHAFIIETSDEIYPSALPASLTKTNIEDLNNQEIAPSPEINFEEIQNSVLESERQEEEVEGYSFVFATKSESNEIKMDFQIAKEMFEKEFIVHALKLIEGK